MVCWSIGAGFQATYTSRGPRAADSDLIGRLRSDRLHAAPQQVVLHLVVAFRIGYGAVCEKAPWVKRFAVIPMDCEGSSPWLGPLFE